MGTPAASERTLARGRPRIFTCSAWPTGKRGLPWLRARGLSTVRAAVKARLRWVGREPGSGARQCLDELLGRADEHHPAGRRHLAHDHRGVADAIRGRWADAGICLRLTSEEAGLWFLSVRREAYDICFPEPDQADPRLVALSGRAIGGVSPVPRRAPGL